MIGMEMVVNYLGYKQVVNEDDQYICPGCQKEYTNEGEGVLCATCAEDGTFEDGE
jgi:predicted amidophosphoribosyltransferase